MYLSGPGWYTFLPLAFLVFDVSHGSKVQKFSERESKVDIQYIKEMLFKGAINEEKNVVIKLGMVNNLVQYTLIPASYLAVKYHSYLVTPGPKYDQVWD